MRRDWLYVAALVLALLAFRSCYDRQQQALGASQQRIHEIAAKLRTAEARGDSLATAKRVQVETLTVRVDRWRMLRDTLLLSDTVRLTRRETVLVQRADSAIAACLVTWGTCESQRATLEERLTLTAAQRDEWQRRASPSLIQRATQLLPWITGAYLIGRITP